MEILLKIQQFLSTNQVLISTIVIALTFLIKQVIDYKAKANPKEDIWDKMKPGSDSLSAYVHKGIEFWGKATGAKGQLKFTKALSILKQFGHLWGTKGKANALLYLQMWFLSMKAKEVAPKPNPSEGPAVESAGSSKISMDTPAVDAGTTP